MNNDVYMEYMVKKKLDAIGVLKIIGLYVAAALVSLLLMIITFASPQIGQYLGQFTFALTVGAFIGAWWLSNYVAVEYEYIYTNGELDVDRIVARRTRKRMLTVSINNFDQMGLAEGPDFERAYKDPNIRVRLNAAGATTHFKDYYAVFNNKDGQRMILIFTPTTKMLEEMKRTNPFKINI
ncbi:MAG: hypothetical protein IJC74_00810 [Clostridia bacterium]|nr:hypothetical protein [Clostridia bacterium]